MNNNPYSYETPTSNYINHEDLQDVVSAQNMYLSQLNAFRSSQGQPRSIGKYGLDWHGTLCFY